MSEPRLPPLAGIESPVPSRASAAKPDRKRHARLAIAAARFLLALSCALAPLAGVAHAQTPIAAGPGTASDAGTDANNGARARPATPSVLPRATSATVGTITRGLLTYYSAAFAGRATASGEPFDPEALTMAHNTLPFGTRVRVTNLRTRKSVVVRVNDRGPHGPRRVGDVSLAAARLLGMVRSGVVEASFEVIDRAQ